MKKLANRSSFSVAQRPATNSGLRVKSRHRQSLSDNHRSPQVTNTTILRQPCRIWEALWHPRTRQTQQSRFLLFRAKDQRCYRHRDRSNTKTQRVRLHLCQRCQQQLRPFRRRRKLHRLPLHRQRGEPNPQLQPPLPQPLLLERRPPPAPEAWSSPRPHWRNEEILRLLLLRQHRQQHFPRLLRLLPILLRRLRFSVCLRLPDLCPASAHRATNSRHRTLPREKRAQNHRRHLGDDLRRPSFLRRKSIRIRRLGFPRRLDCV